MKYKYTREEIASRMKHSDEGLPHGLTQTESYDLANLLLATKETKKKCEDVYIRSYCEAECDCPNCHRGDGADKVKDCVYCQLKWKNKGQYNAKKYPQFAKDRKPFKPSPQQEIEKIIYVDDPYFPVTDKTTKAMMKIADKLNLVIDQVNKLTRHELSKYR